MMLQEHVAIVVILTSAISDAFYRKVYNVVTIPAILLGIILCSFETTGEALRRIVFILILFFVGSFRVMGMGDLKLCMAVCALAGPMRMLLTIFFGSVSLISYCLFTEKKNMLLTLKDTLLKFVDGRMIVKRSEKEYPFALFIAIGYPVACAIDRAMI